jgi:chromate transporter
MRQNRQPHTLPEGTTRPSLPELLSVFLKLGAVSFGGPAMVAYIGKTVVDTRRWLSPEAFKDGVALCQTIPGATAMQCAAFVGWRTRRLPGAVVCYAAFALPAFLFMLSLSAIYLRVFEQPVVASVLTGLRVIVVALTAHAVWMFGKSCVKRFRDGIFAACVAALFLGGCPSVLIIALAALVGSLWFRRDVVVTCGPARAQPGFRALLAPLGIAAVALSVVSAAFLFSAKVGWLSLIMMKIDCLAFGGGFASVPLMFEEIVDVRGWLSARCFMDGIALGQITPGPIVITSTFVGYHAAGIPGALVATASIFLPSLFFLLLAEPWFERLCASARFQAGVRGAGLCFVGLLVSVLLRFAWAAPWNAGSFVIAVAALVALLANVSVLWVVPLGAALSALLL